MFPLFEALPLGEGRCLRVRGGIRFPFFVACVLMVLFSYLDVFPGRGLTPLHVLCLLALRC